MPQRIPKLLLGVVVIAVLVVVAMLVFSPTQSPSYPPLPVPNGYDDFLKAAGLLEGDVVNALELDRDRLRGLVSSNTAALRLLRLGLTRHCSIPTEEAVTNFGAASVNFPKLRLVVYLVAAEGRLAELENRPADAAHSYACAIQMGNEISKGGLIIHRQLGIACEGMGVRPFAKLIAKLNCDQTRPLIAELEKIENDRVMWHGVLKAEKMFVRYTLRTTWNPISHLSIWWSSQGMRKRAEGNHNMALARLRLLMAELALRCYRADHGRAPARLQEIVPKYLQRVPPDPFSGQPLVYNAQGTNWLLYSVGVDRIDDGGQPVSRPMPDTPLRGDLFFDSPW